MIRREKLKHLVTSRMIKGKHTARKSSEKLKMMDGLTKLLKMGRVTDALKAKRDRGAWKVVIAYAKEHGT